MKFHFDFATQYAYYPDYLILKRFTWIKFNAHFDIIEAWWGCFRILKSFFFAVFFFLLRKRLSVYCVAYSNLLHLICMIPWHWTKVQVKRNDDHALEIDLYWVHIHTEYDQSIQRLELNSLYLKSVDRWKWF